MDISSIGMMGQIGQMNQMGQSRPSGPPPGGEKPDASEMSSSIIEENDSDGDGYLSNTEFGISEEMFAQADTDSDGLISQDELISSITARMEEMEANGSAPPPPPGDSQNSGDIDMSQFKSMLADMSAQSESASEESTTQDSLTALLEQLGVSEQEQESIFEMLQNNEMNVFA